jgi:acetyltransferase-like isoleucine patch superfamily enzyme
MEIRKLFWGLRGITYKLRFKKVGRLTYFGKPLVLLGTKRVEVGNRVRIYPGFRMETYGQESSIIIEDNVSIGQNFHITSGGKDLIIGRNTSIAGNVVVTNIDHNYQKIGVHILEQGHTVKTTIINENCYIGYGAVIQAGTILGKQCVVGANSVVRGTFEDYCVIAGVPARIIKRYDESSGEWTRV